VNSKYCKRAFHISDLLILDHKFMPASVASSSTSQIMVHSPVLRVPREENI
jgi:hypothetical protein